MRFSLLRTLQNQVCYFIDICSCFSIECNFCNMYWYMKGWHLKKRKHLIKKKKLKPRRIFFSDLELEVEMHYIVLLTYSVWSLHVSMTFKNTNIASHKVIVWIKIKNSDYFFFTIWTGWGFINHSIHFFCCPGTNLLPIAFAAKSDVPVKKEMLSPVKTCSFDEQIKG